MAAWCERVRGGWATEATDFTAKIAVSGLAPGRQYDVELRFEGEDGTLGEPGQARFRILGGRRRPDRGRHLRSNQLDGTFGPQVEFSKTADYSNQSSRGGNQFFGHCEIDPAGVLTVGLRDASGSVL